MDTCLTSLKLLGVPRKVTLNYLECAQCPDSHPVSFFEEDTPLLQQQYDDERD